MRRGGRQQVRRYSRPTTEFGAITFDPIVSQASGNWVFTARRSTNLSNAESRTINVAGSTTYPPAATGADFGGSFPSTTANFLAGAATATFSVPVNALVQPE